MNSPEAASAGLTPRQQREQWAQSGQFEPLLAEMHRLDPSLMDYEFQWQLVLEAIEVRALQDPESFAEEVLGRLVAFTSYLTIRSQVVVQSGLRRHDRQSSGSGSAALPLDLDKAQVNLAELQGHLAGLLESQATVKRKWNLAKRNGGHEPRRKSSSKVREPLAATPSANGHGKFLDVPLHNGRSINGPANRLNDSPRDPNDQSEH